MLFRFPLSAGFCIVALATSATAQQPMQGMTQEQMQNMMKAGQMMQQCMQQVQEPMQRMQQKAMAMQTEVKGLCHAGKRDEAQEAAMKYGKEMAESQDMQAMKKCGDMAGQMIKDMPMMETTRQHAMKDPPHICDGAK